MNPFGLDLIEPAYLPEDKMVVSALLIGCVALIGRGLSGLYIIRRELRETPDLNWEEQFLSCIGCLVFGGLGLVTVVGIEAYAVMSLMHHANP